MSRLETFASRAGLEAYLPQLGSVGVEGLRALDDAEAEALAAQWSMKPLKAKKFVRAVAELRCDDELGRWIEERGLSEYAGAIRSVADEPRDMEFMDREFATTLATNFGLDPERLAESVVTPRVASARTLREWLEVCGIAHLEARFTAIADDLDDLRELKDHEARALLEGLKPLRLERALAHLPQNEYRTLVALMFTEYPSFEDQKMLLEWEEERGIGTREREEAFAGIVDRSDFDRVHEYCAFLVNLGTGTSFDSRSQVLQDYERENGITPELRDLALHSVGWTTTDWHPETPPPARRPPPPPPRPRNHNFASAPAPPPSYSQVVVVPATKPPPPPPPSSVDEARQPILVRRFETSTVLGAIAAPSAALLGEGGAGSVYRAELPSDGVVAIKRLHDSPKHSHGGTAAFLQEVEILSRMHDPNVIELLGFAVDPLSRFLVFEFCGGGSLETRLQKGDLDWRLRIQVARDAARGLFYLHSQHSAQYVHGDVKPANILLSARGLPAKLADFGLAREIQGGATHVTAGISGTLGYVCPSFARTGRLTPAADVYSFGVVLLSLVTGQEGLDPSRTPRDLVSWVRQKDFFEAIVDPRLAIRREATAVAGVLSVARECLAPEPQYRPTAAALQDELEELNPPEIQHTIRQMTIPPSKSVLCYEEDRKGLRVLVTTFNLGCGSLDEAAVGPWLKGGQTPRGQADIVVVSLQECFNVRNPRAFASIPDVVRSQLKGYEYASDASSAHTRLGMRLLVFTRIRIECAGKDAITAGGLLKGSLTSFVVAWDDRGRRSTYVFTNVHLPAHEGKCEERNAALDRIRQRIAKFELPAVWFLSGDLNYRSNQSLNLQVAPLTNDKVLALAAAGEYGLLESVDELRRQLDPGGCLDGFKAPPCRHMPSYKVERRPGFQYVPNRLPSYTDRVLVGHTLADLRIRDDDDDDYLDVECTEHDCDFYLYRTTLHSCQRFLGRILGDEYATNGPEDPLGVSGENSTLTRVGPLIAKRRPTDPNARRVGILQRWYEREVYFYKCLAPETPVRCPKCEDARYDFWTGSFLLLLEDVSAWREVGGDDCAACVRALGRLHNRWRGMTPTGPIPLTPVHLVLGPQIASYFRWAWTRVRDSYADLGDDVKLVIEDLAADHSKYETLLQRLATTHPTLLHGDFRPDNMRVCDGEVCVFDWQFASVGAGAYDYAYFVALALPPHLRREMDASLRETYLAERPEDPGALDPPDLEAGVLLALASFVMGAATAQDHRMHHEGITRLALAARDWGF
ncbi:hypothetical protein CTAYLR_009798 [Chrysophaeum taylorii]|uniref:Protein kinase domain-containing protein n=1 Tax=Chrysophaeum taylorii TaxID=2483200 RepID=A0AAD7UMW1_9STRA|nr:hypothetical protein CTAYLR_009798 [Chrysophaeum taylorii]